MSSSSTGRRSALDKTAPIRRRACRLAEPARLDRAAQPEAVICGHIHEGFGVDRIGSTAVYNVSYLDASYEHTPKRSPSSSTWPLLPSPRGPRSPVLSRPYRASARRRDPGSDFMTASTTTPERRCDKMTYLQRQSTRRAPQSAPIPGSNQVETSAGFAWAVDDWTRLRRFLILGSEGGSYYAGEWNLTRENAEAVERCLARGRPAGGGRRSSRSARRPGAEERPGGVRARDGRGLGDEATRQAALEALPRVCRISTHLFQFATFVEGFRGWGRSLRRAVGGWYAARSPESLAYQAVKYRQRDGMTHRDLLRLAHPAAPCRRGQPDARARRRAPSPVRVDLARRRRPTACRGSSRASRSPSRRRRRRGRPSSSASTACRGRRSRAST